MLLYSEEEIKDIVKNLKELPATIKEKQLAQLTLKKVLAEKELFIDLVHNRVMSEVLQEMDGDKPRYSSDLKRRIEVDNRLTLSKEYAEAKEAIEKIKESVKLADIEIEYLARVFNAYNTMGGL